MKITTKQRAYLKGLAMKTDPIFQIGKSGISEEIIKQLASALEARELIKVSVLTSSPHTVAEAAELAAEGTGALLVQVIGNRFVLYKESVKHKKIEL